MRTIESLKEELSTLAKRARSLKTKKAQSKAWDAVRAVDREIFLMLCEQRNKYATYSLRGTVERFTDGDRDVFVRMSDGSTSWISPTSDAVSKSWYEHTCCVSYIDGQQVVVEFEIDVDGDRHCLTRTPRRVHGGTLNEQKYAELCKRTDLAFFKYPTGTSGLFSSKGA